MALLAVLLLSLLLSQIALLATGEFEIGRITKWDNLSQYLAEAGIDGQGQTSPSATT